jgi:hypothetical protein
MKTYRKLTTSVGALSSAGVTLGTSSWPTSTWAWRLPSLLQHVFSLLCMSLIPYIPESPLSSFETFKGKVNRRRLMLGDSPGVLTSSTGNIIGAYKLKDFPHFSVLLPRR